MTQADADDCWTLVPETIEAEELIMEVPSAPALRQRRIRLDSPLQWADADDESVDRPKWMEIHPAERQNVAIVRLRRRLCTCNPSKPWRNRHSRAEKLHARAKLAPEFESMAKMQGNPGDVLNWTAHVVNEKMRLCAEGKNLTWAARSFMFFGSSCAK